MIKNISNGYVTFEYEDGEAYCLTIKEYNALVLKYDMKIIGR